MGVLPIRYLRGSAICCGEFSKTAASTLASWLETAKYLILIITTSTVTRLLQLSLLLLAVLLLLLV